jgi:hypothetical protein
MTPSEQIAYIEQAFPSLQKQSASTQTSFWIAELGARGRAIRIKHDGSELKLAATALRFPERQYVVPRFAGPAESLRKHVEGELTVLEQERRGAPAEVSVNDGAPSNWQIAFNALQALGGRATRAAILAQIRVDRPAFDAENLRKDLTMLSVNDSGRFNYRAWETRRGAARKNRDLVFKREVEDGHTVYEIYDPVEHGIWEAYLDSAKKMQLRRQDASIADLVGFLREEQSAFDPQSAGEGKRYVARMIAARQGQQKFRDDLLRAYGGKCCLSQCAIKDIVEAAHIYPFDGKRTNNLTNGLPLRADLHTLFDLGLIRVQISDELTWEIHPALMGDPEYSKYDGRRLVPVSVKPSIKALEQHRKDHADKWEPARAL